ncbi:MAG: NAD(P)/FAD-dependent oxidoreductase [Clostridia bacterium]|nr:NAD(P)/FAD-dependent oxidoreductase [Clostridia bacterium]
MMVVVIGGGAAGLMAAITAALNGADVTLIEKNADVGKKLLITGKGRCNVTNACVTQEIFENIPTNASFLYSAIYGFTNYDVMDFFENCGVPLKTERGERVFPQSDRAKDIVDALKRKANELGVKTIRGRAEAIITNGEKVSSVKTETQTVFADKVILATGGKSYPKTGSTGDGYKIAQKMGHSVTKIKPALVPVETIEDTSALMGLSLRNVSISVFDKNNRRLHSDFGEMLFTHYGLTGPLILSSSSHMGENPEGVQIEIDLKSALDEETLDKRILRDFEKYKNRNFENALSDLLPSKIIGYIIERSHIDRFKKVNSITKEERRRLLYTLKHLAFTVKGYRPVDEAIVTSGGINVKEINASTMESKLIKGLYFAGEVIDVDAYTGGFNLQIAFSTGVLAGKKAAKEEMKEND